MHAMKNPLRVNLVICLLFFTLFLLFGWQLAPIFYFQDSKLMNYAADFFGDLVLTSVDPATGKMFDTAGVYTDTNPLAFSLDGLDELISEIEGVDGVRHVMPLSRRYQDYGNQIQVNNGYRDKSVIRYASSFRAYDFQRLASFYADQGEVLVPVPSQPHGVFLTKRLAEDLRLSYYRPLRIGDTIEITEVYSQLSVRLPYLGMIENRDPVPDMPWTAENENALGVIMDTDSFESLTRVFSPTYRSYLRPPQNLQDVRYKGVELPSDEPYDPDFLTRLYQGQRPSLLSVRVTKDADIATVQGRIQEIVDRRYGNKVGAVQRIVARARDYAMGEQERIIQEETAWTRLLLCVAAYCVCISISMLALNMRFTSQYPVFALYCTLGARDTFILRRISTQVLYFVLPSSVLGYLCGWGIFVMSQDSTSYILRPLFLHMTATSASSLCVALSLVTACSYIRFLRHPFIDHLRRGDVDGLD